MSDEFNAGLPSSRQLQSLIRDKVEIEVQLVSGNHLAGTLKWQDPVCIYIEGGDGQFQIWKQAIAYIKRG